MIWTYLFNVYLVSNIPRSVPSLSSLPRHRSSALSDRQRPHVSRSVSLKDPGPSGTPRPISLICNVSHLSLSHAVRFLCFDLISLYLINFIQSHFMSIRLFCHSLVTSCFTAWCFDASAVGRQKQQQTHCIGRRIDRKLQIRSDEATNQWTKQIEVKGNIFLQHVTWFDSKNMQHRQHERWLPDSPLHILTWWCI